MTTMQPSARQAGPGRAGRWAALGVLMFPVLLVAVDNTVLSFAVPALSTALDPTSTQLLWIIDAYPLVLAGLLVPMGSLGDRIGRRRVLLIGAVGFAAVSAVAAFMPDASLLIAARALMAVFGAMLMPATLSLIRNIFADPTERRTAIAAWASAFSGGAALGPIVGGWLLEHFWWGSVFLLSVPMLLPLVLLAPFLVPESRDPQPGRMDPLGILLAVGTLLPITFGIKAAVGDGSAALAVAAVCLGVACGFAFASRQLRSQAPMLDIRLFRNPTFSAALAVNLLSVFALVGFIYFLSQHLQLIAGLSPMEAGLFMVPGLVLTVVFGFVAVPLVRQIGPAAVVITGLAFSAAAYTLVLALGRSGSLAALLAAFCVLGIGVGLAETISNDLALSAVPPARAGAAAALSETAYEVGSVLGTAVLGSILNAAYSSAVSVPSQLEPSQAAQAQETLGGAVEVAGSMPDRSAATSLLDSAARAFDSGVTITAAIAAALMLVALVVVRLALKNGGPAITEASGAPQPVPADGERQAKAG
ncbi:MFS transporter [Arthrobacter sp. JSM 101049]|uniref:MFS transporter n=1 Tax=Arthrobacter sp. JSM 101049 TaxID=929097 RepID=UPI00356778CC